MIGFKVQTFGRMDGMEWMQTILSERASRTEVRAAQVRYHAGPGPVRRRRQAIAPAGASDPAMTALVEGSEMALMIKSVLPV